MSATRGQQTWQVLVVGRPHTDVSTVDFDVETTDEDEGRTALVLVDRIHAAYSPPAGTSCAEPDEDGPVALEILAEGGRIHAWFPWHASMLPHAQPTAYRTDLGPPTAELAVPQPYPQPAITQSPLPSTVRLLPDQLRDELSVDKSWYSLSMTRRSDRPNADPFAALSPSPRQIIESLSPADWAELTALVDQMDSHEGSFGSWVLPKPIDQNTMVLGYSMMGPLLEKVYDFAYAHCFILPFDWMTWMETEGVQTRIDRPDQLSHLTLEETLGLVTSVFRSYRFNEGALLEAFDNRTTPKLFRHLLKFRPS